MYSQELINLIYFYQNYQSIEASHVLPVLRVPSPLPGPDPIIEMDNAGI